MIKCLSGFEKALLNYCLAKAFAIWEALSWLKFLRVENVMINESNYQVVVNALACPLDDVSKISMLVNDSLMLQE